MNKHQTEKVLYHIIMETVDNKRYTLSTRASTLEKGIRRAREEAHKHMVDNELEEGYQLAYTSTGASIFYKDNYRAVFFVQEKDTVE